MWCCTFSGWYDASFAGQYRVGALPESKVRSEFHDIGAYQMGAYVVKYHSVWGIVLSLGALKRVRMRDEVDFLRSFH